MEDGLSFKSAKPHLKTMRVIGFYQINPNSPKVQRYFHRIYMAIVLFLTTVYTGQEAIKVYRVRNDVIEVIDSMFLLLPCSACIYKQVVLWKKQDRIEELLNILKGPLFNQNEPDHRILLLGRARQARLLLRSFNIVALSTCLLWGLCPLILYVQRKPVEFAIWLPFDPNMSPQIYLAVGYSWVQTSLLACGNTSMDAFISLFFAQSKTQLSILRLDLENLVKKSQDEAKNTSEPLSNILNRRFTKILLHYNEIFQLCKETQNIFGGVLFYLFLISGWSVCTSVYRIINCNPISVEFSSMILYMTCILTEIFLYCYYGNELTYESEKLIESAYAMDWPKLPLQLRYTLIIFMERIKRPIIPLAGAIIPLSNTTFVSVLRSSYTFYAFLKNTDG